MKDKTIILKKIKKLRPQIQSSDVLFLLQHFMYFVKYKHFSNFLSLQKTDGKNFKTRSEEA